jgi:hypothetical protein
MRTLPPEKDPLGMAVTDYFTNSVEAEIIVHSNIAEDDIIPASYLFRDEKSMPEIEQAALTVCRGKILDVGAAAGCHSLLLQAKGSDITALDNSELCCEVMQKRGVSKIICDNFYRYKGDKFDTLLFMMNGIGIAGTLKGLERMLKKAFDLLHTGGRLIFDSSDIEYLYLEEDGSKWINLNSSYYGELTYSMRYHSVQGDPFPWLFIDYNTLEPIARKHGFDPHLFATGKHYDYLGILQKK